MAGNGDAQRLEQVERAIIGATEINQPRAAETPHGTMPDDVVAGVKAVGALCREAGRYARDHGQFVDEISQAFDDKLQLMATEYVTKLMASEERKMGELRRILGKIAG